MTQFPHDQFAKNLLEALLAAGGQVTTALTIDSEVREIDLPAIPATLWFRLLGKGKIQQQAISEVAALSTDSPHRTDALKLFGNLRIILESQKSKKTEDQELIMQLSPLYLAEIQAAEERGEKSIVMRLLNRRVGDISLQVQERIKSLPVEKLEDLGDALLDFYGMEDLTAWLSTNC